MAIAQDRCESYMTKKASHAVKTGEDPHSDPLGNSMDHVTHMPQRTRLVLLTLFLCGLTGCHKQISHALTGPVIEKPRDFILDVNPRVIEPGEAAVLRWSIQGATQVLIEAETESAGHLVNLGTFGGEGSLEIRPEENTTYVVSCQGSTGYSCATATVRVEATSTRP